MEGRILISYDDIRHKFFDNVRGPIVEGDLRSPPSISISSRRQYAR
jgi:hypothetical protein